MPSITYNLDIPDAPNDPSVDQPKMKVNTNAVDSWNAVDHYTFADSNAGDHKQITFPIQNAAGTQTTTEMTIYSGAGLENINISQPLYKNSQGAGAAVPFPMGLVKAYGVFTGSSGATVGAQIYNASVARTLLGSYTVTLSANVVNNSNYGVLLSLDTNDLNLIANYHILSSTSFTIKVRSTGSVLSDPTSLTFIVYQV